MSPTRADFLARIRAELGQAAAPTGPPPRPPAVPAAQRLELLRRELAEQWPALLERFRAEFERVGGVFVRVPSAADVAAAVTTLCRERGMQRLVAWQPEAVGIDVAPALAAAGLDVQTMPHAVPSDAERRRLRALVAQVDAGLTGVDLAVAETGTLVLVSAAGRPRSTSLLPPCHVAVFDREALVDSLEHVGIALEAWHADAGPADRGAVINFITGPSRTADIELTLTRGVHGPKEVIAIFVDAGLRAVRP